MKRAYLYPIAAFILLWTCAHAKGGAAGRGDRRAVGCDTLILGQQNIKGAAYSTFKSFFPYRDCDVLAFNEMPVVFAGAVRADGYEGWHSDTYQSGYGAFMKNAEMKGVAPGGTGALFRWKGIGLGVISYHGFYYPYGPYQMNGVTYKGCPPTKSVDELISTSVNKKERADHLAAMFADEQWMIARGADVIVILGDFNEPSAADYSPELVQKGFKGLSVPWPLTTELIRRGYTDTYREVHPDAVLHPGNTWSPLPGEEPYGIHDRIDFVWFRPVSGRVVKVTVQEAVTLGNANMGDVVVKDWPFDHAGLLVKLAVEMNQ